MANISNAFGEIEIPEEYATNLIDEFIENYKPPYYGVQSWEKRIDENGSTILSFHGAGRWSFDECASDKKWFFNVDDNPKGKELVEYFDSIEDLAFPMYFVDEEFGNEVLYEFVGEYTKDGACGSYETYDYTSRNLIMLKCCEEAANVENEDDVTAIAEDFAADYDITVTDELKEKIREIMRNEPFDGMLTSDDRMYFNETIAEEWEVEE